MFVKNINKQMKKIILIVVISQFFWSKPLNAQVADTSVYLNLIAANKAQYIGQNFSNLVKSLTIQIKDFFPVLIHHQINIEEETSFGFKRYSTDIGNTKIYYPRLIIEWQHPLNKNSSYKVSGLWDGVSITPVLNYYGSCIIKDIRVVQ
jgi:hypothetical protein